jgi:cell division protein FtsN
MHYRDQPPAEPHPTANASPASSKAPEDPHTEPSTAARADAQTATDPARDLTFYDFLPEQEVDVPRAVTPSTAAPPEVRILQAGAFKSTEQAEKLQAQLQLHGIESKIQRYMIDDETWYRVRIGPITSAAEQERIEEKLIEAEVDAQPVVADADVPPP